MTTQYTSILKLALPVQGELSGTWGDVVNDNITSMVEEAVAGRAVINSWTTNSHVLTTADGTTSESRCAMLEFTDTGAALTGAATVVCPSASKLYVCKNDSGQQVTVKTAAGTGVAIPDGQTMFVFCDGTNVEQCTTNFNSLSFNDYTLNFGGAVTTAGAFTTSGAYALTLTTTGTTNVTLPTTGTLATLDGTETLTNKTLTGPTISSPTLTGSISATDVTITGDTTIGDSPTDSLTVNATLASGLVFLDDTYDIGASGATRPRNLYLSGNATIGGTVTLSGGIDVTGALGVDGDFDVNTDKFTVASATGNTVIAGTLGVTGAITATGTLKADTISEITATSGVTVDGVVLKDGGATLTGDLTVNTDTLFVDVSDDVTIAGYTEAPYSLNYGRGQFAVVSSNSYSGMSLSAHSDAAINGSYFGFTRSRGTLGTPSYVQAGDLIGTATAQPYQLSGGTNRYTESASMSFVASQTHSATQNGTDITFKSAEDGTITLYERLSLESDLTVFNEDSRDVDFRVESDSHANMLFVDAGNNRIGVQTNSPSTILNVAEAYDNVLRFDDTRTAVSGSYDSYISWYSYVTTNAVAELGMNHNDYFGATRKFYIKYSGDGPTAVQTRLEMVNSETVFNQDSNNVDFRVESDSNANMLFVDAGTNRLGINTSSPGTLVHIENAASDTLKYGSNPRLELTTPTGANGLRIIGDTTPVELRHLSNNSSMVVGSDYTTTWTAPDATSGAQNKNSPSLAFTPKYWNGSASAVAWQGFIQAIQSSATSTDGYFGLGAGAATDLKFKADGSEAVFNDGGDNTDFRVESDNYSNAFWVDAGNDVVNVRTNGAATYNHKFTVGDSAKPVIGAIYSNAGTFPHIAAISLGSDAVGFTHSVEGGTVNVTGSAQIVATQSASSNAPTDLEFYTTSGGNVSKALTITSAGNLQLEENKDLVFTTASSGNMNINFDGGNGTIMLNSSSAQLRIGTYSANKLWIHPGADGFVWNEDGGDYDFRVESDSNTHMLFVDAGNNQVAVGTSGVTSGFMFGVQGSATIGDRDNNIAGGGFALELSGASLNDTIADYGSYGALRFFATASYTASAKRALITNGYRTNQLGFLIGDVDTTSEPSVADRGNPANALVPLSFEFDGVTVVNQEGDGNLDFRVESDSNTHALFVDAGNDRVGVAQANPQGTLHISPPSQRASIVVTSSYDQRMYGKTIATYNNSGSSWRLALFDNSDNLHYAVKVIARQVSAVGDSFNESTGYASVRWASGVFNNATIHQNMTTDYHWNLSSSMWSLSWVAESGSDYGLYVTASGTGYYNTVFDVIVTNRDGGTVTFDTQFISVG